MSEFDIILENALHRYQRTEFLVGDLIKLVDSWDSDDWVKRQSGGQIDKVREIVGSGHHLRVAGIRGLYNDGSNAHGNQDSADYHYIELVEELAPGRYSNFVTLPVHLIQRVELEGNNVTRPMPDDMVHKSNTHIELVPANVEANDDPMGAVKQTRCDHPAKEMAGSNVKLDGALTPPEMGAPKKLPESYTAFLDKNGTAQYLG